MKKTFGLVLLCTLVVSCIGFVGCKQEEVAVNDNPFIGSWISEEEGLKLEFTGDQVSLKEWVNGFEEPDPEFEGNYTCNGNIAEIFYDNESLGFATIRGTTLTLDADIVDNPPVSFRKE
ncbi:MAG: hypothetical protein J6B81_01345 [Spirochaetaceae bacterium]|nr:hypothetical protein [Spirochaetaceae bacterium]